MSKKQEFAAANFTVGQVNAIIKEIVRQLGPAGPESVLQGMVEMRIPTTRWREEDGIIYLSVTSDGTTGPEWIERFGGKGFHLSVNAKSVLRSRSFKPTSGVTTEIAILKSWLFHDNDRITKKICAEGALRKLTKPNAEVACLIRENFSDEEIEAMGFCWIIVMHESIKDTDGGPGLLGVGRCDDGRGLRAYCGELASWWERGDGFAFVVSQVGPQN